MHLRVSLLPTIGWMETKAVTAFKSMGTLPSPSTPSGPRPSPDPELSLRAIRTPHPGDAMSPWAGV